MDDKQAAARAIGYLEGLSPWLWERTENIDGGYIEAYDRAVETLRKAIDWGGDGQD